MKKVMKKKNYSNRFIYFLVTLGILTLLAGGVYAYNSSPAVPSAFGHSSDEIDFSSGIQSNLKVYPTGGTSYFYVEKNSGGNNYVQIGNFEPGSSGAGFSPLLLDASNLVLQARSGGYVGIGTPYPTAKLEVSGDIKASGSISAGSFLYTSSDERLKTNIKPLQDSLQKVLQLQGVSFNLKSTGQPSVGLIAQDVEKVFPELVSTNKVTGLKSVAYENLVAPLIESVKEQQKEINNLQQQIDELKSKCN